MQRPINIRICEGTNDLVLQLWIVSHPQERRRRQFPITEEMTRLRVKHVKSSAYNSASNAGAKRVVQSIKQFLRKEGIQRVSQDLLQNMCFKVNRVIIQETTWERKQWIETGVIDKARISDDSTNQSFIIALDKGGSCLRNKRFIKHLRDTITMDRDDDAQPDPPHMNTRNKSRN